MSLNVYDEILTMVNFWILQFETRCKHISYIKFVHFHNKYATKYITLVTSGIYVDVQCHGFRLNFPDTMKCIANDSMTIPNSSPLPISMKHIIQPMAVQIF